MIPDPTIDDYSLQKNGVLQFVMEGEESSNIYSDAGELNWESLNTAAKASRSIEEVILGEVMVPYSCFRVCLRHFC